MRKLNKIYDFFFFSESVFSILPATCGVNTLFFFFFFSDERIKDETPS